MASGFADDHYAINLQAGIGIVAVLAQLKKRTLNHITYVDGGCKLHYTLQNCQGIYDKYILLWLLVFTMFH